MFEIVARAYKVFYNLIYVKQMQNRKAHTNLQQRGMRRENVAGRRRLRCRCRNQGELCRAHLLGIFSIFALFGFYLTVFTTGDMHSGVFC